MKKCLLVLMLCIASFSAVRAESFEEINWGEKLAFYLPNRVLDALDTFTVNLGVGATAEARLMFTRYCDIGAGVSASTFKAFKDFNRQYGAGVEEGWYWSFIFVGEEEYRVTEATALLDKYVECRAGVPSPLMRAYDLVTGPRDFWAIGGSLGLLLDGNLYIHPLEFLDFALGFFFIDIKKDDLTFDQF
ncbi:MAG: hypothetical protein IJY46_10755 [Lentisphaeria bacterium]|nr:hypothetical protein [Lentisphaeria bacterium]